MISNGKTEFFLYSIHNDLCNTYTFYYEYCVCRRSWECWISVWYWQCPFTPSSLFMLCVLAIMATMNTYNMHATDSGAKGVKVEYKCTWHEIIISFPCMLSTKLNIMIMLNLFHIPCTFSLLSAISMYLLATHSL